MSEKKRRRAQGAGGVTQLADGRWQARIELGVTADGRRQRKVFYGATKSEAARKLARAVADRDRGLPVVLDDRGTLGSYLVSWLRDSVKPTVRPKTYTSYEYICRVHLIPSLGKIRLTKLEPSDVRSFLAEKIEQGLSPRTAAYCRVVLRRALAVALNDGKVGRNVAAAVAPPRVEHVEVSPLTPAQARSFLTALDGHPLEALFTVAIALGLREGEALGLSWDNVDFERRTLTVQRQLQRIERKLVFTEPKTRKSRRTLTMPAVVADRLRAHRVRQLEQRIAAGDLWQDASLVFTSKYGTPIHPENLGRTLRPLLVKAGLPRQRFHDLRHACASLLLAQGLSLKDVQETLGHAQISMTGDLYAHLYAERRLEIADRMDAILGISEA